MIRVRAAVLELVAVVARDGIEAAEVHGATAPAEGDGAGDRIVTNVPLPVGAVAVEGAGHTRPVAVQCVRWRRDGWRARVHRVVEMAGEHRFSEIRAASAWAQGEWDGDSTLARYLAGEAPGLPPEADPA